MDMYAFMIAVSYLDLACFLDGWMNDLDDSDARCYFLILHTYSCPIQGKIYVLDSLT